MKALLVLDYKVLLVVLQLAQVVVCVLCHHAEFLEGLVYLLVFLRHAVQHPAPRRARLLIKEGENPLT